MTSAWQRTVLRFSMTFPVLRTGKRVLTATVLGPLFAALMIGFNAPAVQAQFNGPPSGVSTLEMNRPAAITTDPAILYPPLHNSVLMPGDTMSVRVYGEPDYSASARVDHDGGAEISLIGHLHVAGLTVAQVDALIAEKLVALGMFVDPHVTVQVDEGPGQNITIFGETHAVVPVKGGNRRLLEVLTTSGGIPPTASHIITINRPGVPEPIVIDIGTDPMRSAHADIPVFAGDTIITSRIGQVYVMGDFKTPSIVPLSTYAPLTLMELYTVSGGPLFTAKKDQMHLIRTVGNRRTVSTFDITKIVNGKEPDPILQPNDMIFLPHSAFKAFFANGTLGQIVGYLSLGISLAAIH